MATPPTAAIVRGEIILEADLPALHNAIGFVYIEDVSRLDADAVQAGRQVITGIDHIAGTKQTMPFIVTVSQFDSTADYSVRVLISRSGDEEIRQGDLISVQSYPVLTHGHPSQVKVEVRQV